MYIFITKKKKKKINFFSKNIKKLFLNKKKKQLKNKFI